MLENGNEGMLKMKKSVKIIIILLLLPLVFDIAVMLTNTVIADRVEAKLLEYELPEKTQLADSLSTAQRLYGNGNGMQYIGQLLVTTELTEEELNAYYDELNEEIRVKRLDSPVVSEFIPRVEFKNFDSSKNNYMIELVNVNPGTFDNYLSENFFWKILDWDIRGH